MAKKDRRKRRRGRASEQALHAVAAPLLKMRGPGLLGFLLPVRPDLGLHDVNSLRSNMIRSLADHGAPAKDDLPDEDRPGPALDSIPPDERAALLLSLATTICRAEYHERRFQRITQHLAERRLAVAVPIFYEAHAWPAVFEGAAALGAARTAVDEIVHIAARRNGEDHWEISKVIKDGSAKASVAEILHLRARGSWYDSLNKYRNVLYHRGWRGEPGAYFPPEATEPEAQDPERNILLVPDLASLEDDARAHRWTYSTRRHLEPVVQDAVDGMRAFIDVVAMDVWEGKLPTPGTIPVKEQPNVLVAFPRPAPFLGAGTIYLPVFSSRENAEKFRGYPDRSVLQLATLPLVMSLFPEPAFGLSVAGLEPHVTTGTTLTVLIDPISIAPIRARIVSPIVPSLIEKASDMDPIGLSKAAINAEQVVCWKQVN